LVRCIGMPLRSLALVMILASCSGAGATTTQPSVVAIESPTIPSAAPTTSSAPTDRTTTPVAIVDEPDLLADNALVFVATLEEAFAGTSFEGAVLESPELFIATAEVICVRLDNGDEIDQILLDYIDGLSNADGADNTVSENEAAAVAGGVLGASLELFCPEHRQLIED